MILHRNTIASLMREVGIIALNRSPFDPVLLITIAVFAFLPLPRHHFGPCGSITRHSQPSILGRPPYGTDVVAWSDTAINALVYGLIIILPHLLLAVAGGLVGLGLVISSCLARTLRAILTSIEVGVPSR